jgi:hypothetical protein
MNTISNFINQRHFNLGYYGKISTWIFIPFFLSIFCTFAIAYLAWIHVLLWHYILIPLLLIMACRILSYKFGHRLTLDFIHDDNNETILFIKDGKSTLYQSKITAQDIAIRPMIKHPLAASALTEVYEIVVLLQDLPETVTKFDRYQIEKAIIVDTIVLDKEKALAKASELQNFIFSDNRNPPQFLQQMSYYP